MSEALLSGRGLSYSIGGRPARVILRDLNLDAYGGQILGLVGPNGVGKTTLIRLLVGRLRPTSGEVVLRGEVLAPKLSLAARARRGMGYLPQQPSVFRSLSVWENLMSVPCAAAEAAQAVLERVSLSGAKDRSASQLSGGERRRLEVARLMLMRAQVVLCDEPFAGLDPIGITALSDLLRELAASGCAVVVTDHRVEALFPLCDEIALMLDTQIVRRASPAVLEKDLLVRERYLGV